MQEAITDWDDAYSNGGHIAGAADYPPRWAAQAAAFREQVSAAGRAELDLPYGDAAREVMDLFHPEGQSRGLVVFVHGGYWRAFDKNTWSHLAAGAMAHGWSVGIPSYTLCPHIRISAITRQVGAAITRLASRVAGPIRLTGHSAGGHLVSRMCCADAPLADEVRARIAHVVSISGLHDMRPLLKTAMNDDFRMDEAEAVAESAALLTPWHGVSITCWAGGDERPEFIRQNALLANVWRGLGVRTNAVVRAHRHHFTVIDDLADSSSRLVTELLQRSGDEVQG